MNATRYLTRIVSLLLLSLAASCSGMTLAGSGPTPPLGPQDPDATRGTMGVTQAVRVRYVADCTHCTIVYTAADGQVKRVDERSGLWQKTVAMRVRSGSAVLTANPIGQKGRISSLRIYVDDQLRARSDPRAGTQSVTIATPVVGTAR